MSALEYAATGHKQQACRAIGANPFLTNGHDGLAIRTVIATPAHALTPGDMMTTRFFARQRTIEGASDRLGKDLRSAVDDANYLLKDMANTTAEEFASAATRIGEKVAEARDRFDDARLAVSKKARVAADATQEYVLDNPWKVIGVAAAVGLIIGVFASSRR